MPKEDTQFKKGKSGNPKGRPKGLSLTEEISKYLAEKELDEDGKPTGRTNARAFIELVVEKAAEGNPEALKQVINRLDGPVPQVINVSNLSTDQLIAILGAGEEGSGSGTGEAGD